MATPEQWEKIKEIVGTALEQEPAKRPAFLDAACAGDVGLRNEVESLIAAHADADGLSENPWAATVADPVGDTKTIGPYRLIHRLGVGGMGQVWLAEQSEPVRRRIALKLIRAGVYDEALVKRFQSERQSLAIMEHPAIAKVFDAGATPEGQPYFAMEYVDGPPITDYCDKKKLGIRDRLKLFAQVCEGVQHAHQKAIIHRDLKPSNILITEVDGKPTPRIIDFGLAKATMTPVPGETLFTQVGAFLGTPGYMSPEQADPNVRDIDTRTDVYSLGVILYELLTGSLPFDTTQWKDQRLDEVLRQLKETDPERPSAKVGQNRDTSTAHAEARSTEPGQLVSSLRGDLDWITLRALEKDRDRRYGTPSALSGDVENYLENRPVEARPASATYRLRKYIRRHGIAVAVATGSAALLIAFAVTQSIELRRITRERDRADRITEFMTNMFKVSDPSEARGNSITAREILDKSSKEIDSGLAKDPLLQAQLTGAMARTYQGLGLYPRAHALYERALETDRRLLGDDDPATLTMMRLLAWTLMQQGHYPEAEVLLRKALDGQRRVLGAKHRETLASMNALGWTISQQGHYADADRLLREAVETDREVLGKEDHETLSSMHHLASNLGKQGHVTEAGRLKRELLDTERRVLGPENPLVLVTTNNLAFNLHEEGKYTEAEAMYRDLLEVQRRVLGPEHPETLWTMRNMGVNFESEGNVVEAEKHYRDALTLQRRVLGNEHPDTQSTTTDLAILLREEGHYAESESLLRGAVEVQRKALGPESPTTLDTIGNLGQTLRQEGRYIEAETLLRETLAVDRRVLGPSSPTTLESIENLATTLRVRGQCAESEKLFREALDAETRERGADNPGTLEALTGLGSTLSCERRYPEAEAMLKVAIDRAVQSQDRSHLAILWYGLACAAAIEGKKEDAISHLRLAIANGNTDTQQMRGDPDLKALRGDARLETLIAETQKHPVTTAQKAN
ncbi:MAG: serine/threonine protein kinase [Acidobacteria bacterium]|nr:serine/threonine protein kinase [Acidobacteriota bacterium]